MGGVWLGLYPGTFSGGALAASPGQRLQVLLWQVAATEITEKCSLDSSALGSITLQLENDLDTFSLISISLLHQCCLALS